MRKSFLNRTVAPFFSFLLTYRLADALELFAVIHQSLGGIGTPVEQYVLNQYFQLRLNLFINLKHASVHDAHIHAGCDGVIKKRGVNGFADLVISAETE